tara:strand:+ start:5467 stop:5664 length:198 start_codon:yes stop_codon:yes gene_type:complete
MQLSKAEKTIKQIVIRPFEPYFSLFGIIKNAREVLTPYHFIVLMMVRGNFQLFLEGILAVQVLQK